MACYQAAQGAEGKGVGKTEVGSPGPQSPATQQTGRGGRVAWVAGRAWPGGGIYGARATKESLFW